jgi:hypothetical protein
LKGTEPRKEAADRPKKRLIYAITSTAGMGFNVPNLSGVN